MADPLFTKAELEAWLSYDADAISETEHGVVEKVVRGWVLSATGWTEVPATTAEVPEQVAAWALELGGIAYENPTDQQYDSTNLVQASWRDRKSQILAELALWAASTGTTVQARSRPRGSFPKACPYPDPAHPWGMRP